MADVDYLIPQLRLRIGEFDPATYVYSTDTLSNILIAAVRELMRKWRRRYTIDSAGIITRNANHVYENAEPPVIDYQDEVPIVLQAVIILKMAEIQDNVWDIQSWRDDEIAFSNLGAGRLAEYGLDKLQGELDELLRKRLYGSARQELPGFRLPYNIREG